MAHGVSGYVLYMVQYKICQRTKLAQYESDFVGKFIFISNQEENFMHIEKGGNRYLVLKVPALEADNIRMKQDLNAEASIFLAFLLQRKLYHEKKSSVFFDSELLKTAQLEKVIQAGKSSL